MSVKGYKSICQERYVDINGLTILSGANSSGKSSFMQPLLLIKQTLENNFDAGSLLLDGTNVKVNDSSEIISRVGSSKSDRLEVAVSYANGSLSKASYKYYPKRGIHISEVSVSEEGEAPRSLNLAMKPHEVRELISPELVDITEKTFHDRNVEWRVIRGKCFLDAALYLDKAKLHVAKSFSPGKSLENLALRLIHVPGLRGNPERSYKVASTDSLFPGSFDRYVASLVHEWRTVKRKNFKFKILVDFLERLGLASSIDTNKVNESRVEIKISRFRGCATSKSNFVNIADVGFGVSQTLPVLVAILAARKGQIVYIEQPELHLHPKAQFELSKIIAEAVDGAGVKVIVETHSSVLIRGIQIEVAKKRLNPSLVSLNWFSQSSVNGQTNVERATLDEYGAFGDWPEDFDQTSLMVEQEYLDAVEEAAENATN